MQKRTFSKILLGLGFDCKDGHIRVTKGKNFRLYGGSETTHQMMQEKAVKFNEQLDRHGKSLEAISKKEFYDIAHKVGLEVPENEKKQ
jgi:hypothetical protein